MDLDWGSVPAPKASVFKKSTIEKSRAKKKTKSILIDKHCAKKSPMETGCVKKCNKPTRIVKRGAKAPKVDDANKSPIKCISQKFNLNQADGRQTSSSHNAPKHRDKSASSRPSTVKAASRILKQKNIITIGSDCTGLGTDEIAMRRVLGLDCANVFASEIDEVARRMLIATRHAPATMYEDITSAARRQAPHVDVYTAGFPCQPYSAAGLNLGMKDPRCVVSSVIHYIETKLPTLFVLENVKNIMSIRHKARPTQEPLVVSA